MVMVRQLNKRENNPYSFQNINNLFNIQRHLNSHTETDSSCNNRLIDPQSSTSSQITRVYPEKSKPGRLLIFNHTFFEINDKGPRKGTQFDENNLIECFGTHFGFNVYVYQDLKHDQIFEILNQEASQHEVNYGCLMVIILTYGDKNGLYACDEIYSLESLFNVFKNKLSDTPKVFLFQFGRDNNIQVPTKYPEDMLAVYSSSATQCSYRNVDEGSWFITVLTKHFKNLKEKSVLTYEIDHVCKKVEKMAVDMNASQKPEFKSTLKKILFIRPLKEV